MPTTHRKDEPDVTCPDCGSQVFREYVEVKLDQDEFDQPNMVAGRFGCRNADCGWSSDDRPIVPKRP